MKLIEKFKELFTAKTYRIPLIHKKDTEYKLKNMFGYNLYKTKELYYKELKVEELKIEIDCFTGVITAYKKDRSYTAKWRPVRMRYKWIQELEDLINPKEFVGVVIDGE